MKPLLAVFKVLVALALVPLSLDWRSPFLFIIRDWALLGLISLSMILILAEIRALQATRTGPGVIRTLSVVGLVAAALALTATLVVEARFHWMRRQVLHADPNELERLGRHLIVGCRDLEDVRELVKLRAIGGIFLTSRNVRGWSVEELQQEIRSLQAERTRQSLPPLWITTDQEGGVVSRLSSPLTRLPALSEIVERDSDVVQRERSVRQFAARQGLELAGVGVNLNLAPVVDLNHQIMNPHDRFTRIYLRAISGDPSVVTQVAGWYCAELEKTGVRCTLKHFPGLGRVNDDTHLGHADLTVPVSDLTDTDWMPFRVLMSESKAFIMLGHVRLTAIDGARPASLSPPVISGILRGQWKYDGVLITDDFSMRAVYRSSSGIEHGSVDALNAGVDLILVSWDCDLYYEVMYGLLKADRQGRLDREVLRQSDQRLARAIRFPGR